MVKLNTTWVLEFSKVLKTNDNIAILFKEYWKSEINETKDLYLIELFYSSGSIFEE